MNKYIKPELNEIVIEIEDVIAASGQNSFDVDGILSGNPHDTWFNK